MKLAEQVLNNKIDEAKTIDKIGKFWVVTKPTGKSELIDIVFEADVARIMLQAKGGLEPKDIVGIYPSENEAKKVAEKLLK